MQTKIIRPDKNLHTYNLTIEGVSSGRMFALLHALKKYDSVLANEIKTSILNAVNLNAIHGDNDLKNDLTPIIEN